MSITSILSSATRAALQKATDVVTESPFTCAAVAVGIVATGVYVARKSKKEIEKKKEAVVTQQQEEQRKRIFVEKPQSAKPKPQAQKPQPEPVQPVAQTEQEKAAQEQAKQEQEEAAKVFTEENLYNMDPSEMLKKPKIQKIYQAFDEAHNKDFPADLTQATENLTTEAHLRMADLVNTSRSFDVNKMRHDDLLTMARSSAANARMSMRYTNRIHSTRTFMADTKIGAKLILALLGTAVKRNHAEHFGTEAKGMTEAIALIDECYARGVTAVYFYESLVYNAPDERERQLIEHQVRIMVDMADNTFAQSVVF